MLKKKENSHIKFLGLLICCFFVSCTIPQQSSYVDQTIVLPEAKHGDVLNHYKGEPADVWHRE